MRYFPLSHHLSGMITPEDFVAADGLARLYKACSRDKRIVAACQRTSGETANAAHDGYLRMLQNWNSILLKCQAERNQMDYLIYRGVQFAADEARSKKNGYSERRTGIIWHVRESDSLSLDGTTADDLFGFLVPDIANSYRINANAPDIINTFLIHLCHQRNDLHRLLMRTIYDPPKPLNAAQRLEIKRAFVSWCRKRRIPGSGKHGRYRFFKPNDRLLKCCPGIDEEWAIPANARILGETLGTRNCADDVIWTTDALLTEPYKNDDHACVVYVDPQENQDGSWRATSVILWPGRVHPPPTYMMSPYSYLVAGLILIDAPKAAA